ncbi:F0F1 ATP synthase subunit B [Metaclostridioides mangenotii]|uniref:ATP synthase subunit b n=1 Tax=Metaclostridioides mangenotii TaxID=1540 RepID=A0ABS4EEE8_9FIRM|nr:F0F1 ATP synthase subunit B [Clostridioides mangenotii]MBP1856323.1 F-type H+-transporting ATPase subunit b [Clostridioides mangenotii]
MELKPLVSITYELAFQIANTILIFWIIKKLLYKPVMKIVNARESEIKADMEEGERNKAEGLALKKAYEEKVGLAKREGQEIIKQAKLRAESKSEELVNEAKQEAAHIKEKANEEIVKEKQKAMNDIKSSVSDIALLAAAKVIKQDIDKAKHEELINNFINEVGEAK